MEQELSRPMPLKTISHDFAIGAVKGKKNGSMNCEADELHDAGETSVWSFATSGMALSSGEQNVGVLVNASDAGRKRFTTVRNFGQRGREERGGIVIYADRWTDGSKTDDDEPSSGFAKESAKKGECFCKMTRAIESCTDTSHRDLTLACEGCFWLKRKWACGSPCWLTCSTFKSWAAFWLWAHAVRHEWFHTFQFIAGHSRSKLGNFLQSIDYYID